MPMDVDAIAANMAIKDLKDLLLRMPQMGREEIANDIIDFVKKMEEKYKKD